MKIIYVLLALFLLTAGAAAINTVTISRVALIDSTDLYSNRTSYTNDTTPSVTFTISGNATKYTCGILINGTTIKNQTANVANATAKTLVLAALSQQQLRIQVNCTNVSRSVTNVKSLNWSLRVDTMAPVLNSNTTNDTWLYVDQNITITENITEKWPYTIKIGNVYATNTSKLTLAGGTSTWRVRDLIGTIYDLSGNCTYTGIPVVVTDYVGRSTTKTVTTVTSLPCIKAKPTTPTITMAGATRRALLFTLGSDIAITSGLNIWMPNGSAYNATRVQCNYSASGADITVQKFISSTAKCNLTVTRAIGDGLDVAISPSIQVSQVQANPSNWPNGITLTVGLIIGAIGAAAVSRRHYKTSGSS